MQRVLFGRVVIFFSATTLYLRPPRPTLVIYFFPHNPFHIIVSSPTTLSSPTQHLHVPNKTDPPKGKTKARHHRRTPLHRSR